MSEPQASYNPKDLVGMTKVPLRFVPPALVLSVAPAMAEGAKKYGPYNWRVGPPIQLGVYIEAAMRHLLALQDGQDIDPDSGIHHAAKAAACMAVLLDALALGKVRDDRVAPGPAPAIIAKKKEE